MWSYTFSPPLYPHVWYKDGFDFLPESDYIGLSIHPQSNFQITLFLNVILNTVLQVQTFRRDMLRQSVRQSKKICTPKISLCLLKCRRSERSRYEYDIRTHVKLNVK
jgi:hypothetical protein